MGERGHQIRFGAHLVGRGSKAMEIELRIN